MQNIEINENSELESVIHSIQELEAIQPNSDKNFTDAKWSGNNILLFGSEGHGLNKHTEKYTDFSVKINNNKNVESLNISNSAAIVFHHINQQK